MLFPKKKYFKNLDGIYRHLAYSFFAIDCKIMVGIAGGGA